MAWTSVRDADKRQPCAARRAPGVTGRAVGAPPSQPEEVHNSAVSFIAVPASWRCGLRLPRAHLEAFQQGVEVGAAAPTRQSCRPSTRLGLLLKPIRCAIAEAAARWRLRQALSGGAGGWRATEASGVVAAVPRLVSLAPSRRAHALALRMTARSAQRQAPLPSLHISGLVLSIACCSARSASSLHLVSRSAVFFHRLAALLFR